MNYEAVTLAKWVEKGPRQVRQRQFVVSAF